MAKQKYFLNPSLSLWKDAAHYIARLSETEQERLQFRTLSLKKNEVNLLQSGKSAESIRKTMAQSRFKHLVQNQVFLPCLSLPVTGASPLQEAIAEASRCGSNPWVKELRKLARTLSSLDQTPAGPDWVKQAIAAENAVQLDLELSTRKCRISRAVATELGEALRIITELFSGDRIDPLSDLKNDFRKIYGEEWVPIQSVFDSKFGISFDLKKTLLAYQTPYRDLASPLLNFLLDRIRGQHEIQLEDQEIKRIIAEIQKSDPTAHRTPLPRAVSAFCRLSNDQKIDLSFFTHMSSRILGRFTPQNEKLAGKTRELIREENRWNPAAVPIELVHVPHAKSANVLRRASDICEYELVLLAKPKGAKNEISIDDLLISLDTSGACLMDFQDPEAIKDNALNYLPQTRDWPSREEKILIWGRASQLTQEFIFETNRNWQRKHRKWAMLKLKKKNTLQLKQGCLDMQTLEPWIERWFDRIGI